MRLHIVDVFAETRYAGNQLAVVRDCASVVGRNDADDRARDEFLRNDVRHGRIANAREGTHLHAGRRAAVRRPSDDRHGVGVGAHAAELHARTRRGQRRSEFRRCRRRCVDDAAEADARRTVPGRTRSEAVATRRLPTSIPKLPSQFVAIGPKFVFVGVRDLAALRRARLDEEYFHACRAEGLPINSVFLFAPQAYSNDAHYSARLFFDANGVREDPATGSANSGFAAYLHAHLKKPIDVIVEQGFEIKRPSRLYLRADGQGLRVGGRVQAVSEGRLLRINKGREQLLPLSIYDRTIPPC